MKVNTQCRLSRRKLITGAAQISALTFPLAIAAQTWDTTFLQHKSQKSGFFANTYLIEGDHSCALVDAHLNIAEAEELAKHVRSIGKPLDTIVITHPHPDHYLGLEYIAPQFPNAVIRAAPLTLQFIRTTAADWPAFPNVSIPLQQGKTVLVGINFECLLMPDAESVAPIVLFEAESQTLIAGDHILNNQHLWLAEGRGQAWQRNLAFLKTHWPIKTVLPGHGAVGGVELISSTEKYLADFTALSKRMLDAETLRQEMLHRYPAHVFSEALDQSILSIVLQ